MTQGQNRLDAIAISAMVVLCFTWGFQQVVIKLTAAEIPPLLQAGLRSSGATLLLWFWMLWRRQAIFERDGTLLAGLGAGLLFAGEFALIYHGLQFTSASRSVIMLYTAPFWVALGAHLLLPGERIRPIQLVGLAAAFTGILLAFADAIRLPNPTELLGDVLLLAAGIFWAATTLLIKASPLAGINAAKTLLYQLAVSALVLPCLSVMSDEGGIRAITPFVAGSLAFQIVGVAFTSYLVWFWLMRHYPASRLSAFSFLTPLFGVLIGSFWLNEPLTPWLLAALVLVGGGIYLVNRPGAEARSLAE